MDKYPPQFLLRPGQMPDTKIKTGPVLMIGTCFNVPIDQSPKHRFREHCFPDIKKN